MVGKACVLAVLDNEQSARPKERAFEDELREAGQLWERVGRVGKNEVEGLIRVLDDAQCVGMDGAPSGVGEGLLDLAKECEVVEVAFDGDHSARSSRE